MAYSAEDDPLIGATVDGKYSIVELIGKGGMGSVYRAEHNLMERTVAIKFLSITEINESTEEYLRRFKQEAQTASQIRHPSAITIYDYGIGDFGDRDDSPFLVMEYIEGRTLKSVIKEGPVPAERLIPLIVQVCGALDEAHNLGIIHRDLKPDNIMVSSRGDDSEWAHVLDFGIAKKINNTTGEANMTRTGSVIGTPKYMSPEQILTKEVDQRADVYSLGLIIYEALSGALPFKSASLMELAVMHVKEAPEPLLKRAPELKLSKAFEKIVMSAIEKDPDNRPQSARKLSNDLREAFPLDFDDSSGSYTFTGIRAPKIQTGSNKPLIFGGAALLLALVVGAAFAMQSGGGEESTAPMAAVKPPAKKAAAKKAAAETPPPSLAPSLAKKAETPKQKASKTRGSKSERAALMKLLVGDTEEVAPAAPEKKPAAPEKKVVVVKTKAEPKQVIEVKTKATPTKTTKSVTRAVASTKSTTRSNTKTPVSTINSRTAAQADAERRLRAAEQRAAESERKAKLAEQQAQKAERRRKAAEAKRAKEQEALKNVPPPAKQVEQAPEKKKPPRVRRRCGPTWCN